MKVRTEARRSAIVEEATRLFTEFGYERASMNELTHRLGGSKATLYGYFASKEALFVAVIQDLGDRFLTDAIDRLTEAAPEDFEGALRRFGESLVGTGSEEGPTAVFRMVVGESGRSDVGSLFFEAGPRRVLDAVTEYMRRVIAHGGLRRGNPAVLARQYLGLLRAEGDDRLYQRNPTPLSRAQVRAMVERAIETFLHGCAAR